MSENKKLAAELQTTLYHQCGYWLPIVNTNAGVTDKYIAIVLNKISGGDGFEIKINDSNLEIIPVINPRPEDARAHRKAAAKPDIKNA